MEKSIVLDSSKLQYSARVGGPNLNFTKLSNETAATIHNYDNNEGALLMMNSARLGIMD